MSYLDSSEYDDPPGRWGGTRSSGRSGRRPPPPARPAGPMSPAGPMNPAEAVAPGPGHRYGDGVSAHPLYGGTASTSPAYPGGPAGYPADAPAYPGSPPGYPASPPTYPASAPSYSGGPAGYPGSTPGYPASAARSAGGPGGQRRPPAPPPPAPRAGRNLPAAIGVGLALGAAVLASLFFWRPAFLGVIAAAVVIGIWELVRAVRQSGARPPLAPLVSGGVLMTALAWWGQADALVFGLVVTVLVTMVWRLADGSEEYGRDVIVATFIAIYVPFLAGFAALLARPSDGALRVVATLAGVVLSDTGGYIAGVLFGRHPMAPGVSPKKSWEGLIGSLLAAGVGGAVLLSILFHIKPWYGAAFGVAISIASVVGDLGESLLKRDLGVKDMSNLLPGHGGLMDRLDSIVLAVPTGYVLLTYLAAPG
jgi:phosphatidate cytidylyltransferase